VGSAATSAGFPAPFSTSRPRSRRGGVDSEAAADGLNSVAHSRQADAPGSAVGDEALAIVDDGEFERPLVAPKRDRYACSRTGVLGCILDRFACAEVDRCLDRVRRPADAMVDDAHGDWPAGGDGTQSIGGSEVA
jgi:hypothetical protein